ncbi:MAG TPA: SDR family NAD(P)-dependent oxidoreductase [Acidimicrobiales bacterium]|jgi:NAD(P)-dependent dehydrogenase (short-subunit alcohol dehydrogenase family)|nr:SDR family NAD(P)-dependent oxidoreductase [Acidimicrobiales bacterium]
MDELAGRTAVITGGASGIGLATARLLGAEGMQLVLADIEEAPLERAAAELDALGVVCDVGELASVQRLADQAYERFGAVHLLFNNAGVATGGPVVQMSHADWEWVMRVNLWGPIHGVEAFLERMIAQGTGGHILFTASFAGLVPNVGLGPYCVTKYGTVALAEVLQRELRPHRIGVSVLCPMRVETNIGTSARNRPAELGGPVTAPAAQAPPTSAPAASAAAAADAGLAGRVLPVDEVAADVVRAVTDGRLYILPHEESTQFVRRRFARIERDAPGSEEA